MQLLFETIIMTLSNFENLHFFLTQLAIMVIEPLRREYVARFCAIQCLYIIIFLFIYMIHVIRMVF